MSSSTESTSTDLETFFGDWTLQRLADFAGTTVEALAISAIGGADEVDEADEADEDDEDDEDEDPLPPAAPSVQAKSKAPKSKAPKSKAPKGSKSSLADRVLRALRAQRQPAPISKLRAHKQLSSRHASATEIEAAIAALKIDHTIIVTKDGDANLYQLKW